VRPACLAIALGFLCLVLESPLVPQPTLVQQMELRLLDWHARLRGRRPAPANISIVAIDETSLELVGRWPWPRTRTAEIIQHLAEGGARVIALDLLLREPDENNRLVLARSLAEHYRALGIGRTSGPATEFGRLPEEALGDADTDETLARALAATRRVVVCYFFVFPSHESMPLDDDAQRLLNRSRIVGFATPETEEAIEARRAAAVQLPLSRFMTASAGNGHVRWITPPAGGDRGRPGGRRRGG
jgi:CHASE2 domain